jgi:hypothetical protein
MKLIHIQGQFLNFLATYIRQGNYTFLKTLYVM